MSRAQVLEKLGPPDEVYDEVWAYWPDTLECYVTFSPEDLAVEVKGNRLELGATDYTPEVAHGELSRELFEFLGEEDWKDGERGDFVHSWGYDDYALVLQLGCTGWFFVLGGSS
jgi:hypothetical protein